MIKFQFFQSLVNAILISNENFPSSFFLLNSLLITLVRSNNPNFHSQATDISRMNSFMKILLRRVFYTGSRSWRFHRFDRKLISSVISQIVIDTGNSDMRLGNRTHERHRNKQSFLEDDPRSWLHQRRSSIDFRPSESSFPNARSTRLLTRVLIPIKDEQQSCLNSPLATRAYLA